MSAGAEEYFDVVDEEDRVVGRETRAQTHQRRLRHRAVHVLVFNPRGEIFLQRRSAAKDTYPGRWTTSCSGHVDAGEDYTQAVRRELVEELGVKLPAGTAPTPFRKHPPCRDTGWEFIWIYHLTHAGPLTPDAGEIAEGRWVTPAALDAWIERAPRDFTPSFRLVWGLWRKPANAAGK